jgi:hypothetical protein
MAKSARAFSGPVILLASLFLFVGCDGGTQVELAKPDPNLKVDLSFPKEGKKREELPKSLRPPAKGSSYGITHDHSKGQGAGGAPR